MQRPRVTLTFNYPCGCTRTNTEMGRDFERGGITDAMRKVLAWFDTRSPRAPCETGDAPPHPPKLPQAQT